MKTKLFFFLFTSFCLNVIFGQNNQSANSVTFPITPVAVTVPPTNAPNEIFRFRPGNITQLDLGSSFTFNNARWFSMGSVVTGTNTAYGLRFQLPNRAVTFGYQSIASNNPRIEWIGTGTGVGNLEFRVANSFTSTTSTLVATMTSFGNSVFGDLALFGTPSATSAEVGIASNNTFSLDVKGGSTAGVNIDNSSLGLKINTSDTGADIVAKVRGINILAGNGSTNAFGANIETTGGADATSVKVSTRASSNSFGIDATAVSGSLNNIAVFGRTPGTSTFEASIFGRTPVGTNRWAGYFDGNVFTTGSYLPSDNKLKSNVTKELNAIEKLNLLNPVTYTYNKISEMNLPEESQHGFISQEFATVFPELTKDITKPVFDNDGKIVSNYTFKGINYNGLISVLTAGFKELNAEVVALKQELADYKANDAVRKALTLDNNISGVIMEQNVPNPFSDQTTIKFQLPKGSNDASIIVMDLNGKLIKEFAITQSIGELKITANEIGKGLFLYSLINNGNEIITKKMVIK
ncbi:tail fiber domain-containing protein [Flavobacterium sp.]|uniref:tail fiber domain-containing protein n=1 Tax=Flavobacterium sp. TaxID=239 RepID=UPI002636505B|nr:tail fiber domain-containing protein [Flavobacterium sp.]